ncbi:hypothetical protein KP509_1Z034500 [Ceratopteris richardii]|nr:hypothetical protein KP509_1Z034500 [Ceratopteris richardii]
MTLFCSSCAHSQQRLPNAPLKLAYPSSLRAIKFQCCTKDSIAVLRIIYPYLLLLLFVFTNSNAETRMFHSDPQHCIPLFFHFGYRETSMVAHTSTIMVAHRKSLSHPKRYCNTNRRSYLMFLDYRKAFASLFLATS